MIGRAAVANFFIVAKWHSRPIGIATSEGGRLLVLRRKAETSSTGGLDWVIEQLERLHQLRREGVLTKANSSCRRRGSSRSRAGTVHLRHMRANVDHKVRLRNHAGGRRTDALGDGEGMADGRRRDSERQCFTASSPLTVTRPVPRAKGHRVDRL